MQTIPASAQLGFAYVGATGIGVRTVRLDKTTVVTATTTVGVAEAPASSGQFQRGGGIEAHDEGGYIVWTHNGDDILWDGIAAAGATTETIQGIVDAIEALGASASINLINVVDGGKITVYRGDTWAIQLTVPLVLTDYQVVALIAKDNKGQADDEATLYVRSDVGLVRIGGAAPSSASNGSLIVDDATHLTVTVHMPETVNVEPIQVNWWIKLFDTTADPDEGYTRVKGQFVVENYGLRAIE